MKPARTAMITLMLACALAVLPASAQDIVLQIGSSAPVNSPWDLGLKKIAAEWARVSGGKVRVVLPGRSSSGHHRPWVH